MKIKLSLLTLFVISVFMFSCKKGSPEKSKPVVTDSLISQTPHTKAGINNILLGAYGLLDGVYAGQNNTPWETGTDNWAFGSVAGGDAFKGGSIDDQTGFNDFDKMGAAPGNGIYFHKWDTNITALKLSNAVLKLLPLVNDGSVSAEYKAIVTAQARFLRGFYEFELAKIWRNVPYIDENVASGDYYKVINSGPIWDKIEADFKAAMDALPSTQVAPGRPNKYAAEAFLVKALMFDHKYADAKPLLSDLINNGVTANGTKYGLVHYADNFNPLAKPNAETVFLIPAVVHNGSDGLDGNAGDIMNFPHGGPADCCAFFRPSFSFVNAFKTDAVTGLPLLDTYNNADLKNDQAIESTSPFTPATETLDSRLDWSVGRRGIPYLDWGVMPGMTWTNSSGGEGPYVNIKTVYYQAAQAATSETFQGWDANAATSNGYNAIRFADVLLWAAEVEVETGNLQNAEDYVNRVRLRAADATGWVHAYADPSNPTGGYTGTPAANYKVGLYGVAGGHPTTGFAAGGQDYARKAVYFERMIELGMEGHRFFDLQRWDGLFGGPAGTGYMAAMQNVYRAHEANVSDIGYAHFIGFTGNKDELYPIPKQAMDKSGGKLKQNPGY